jgi:hypothetical protein
VATPGSASANSYCTEAEADAYMEARLNSSLWTGTEPKKQALVEAQRELTALSYCGLRVDTTQALAWPRQWALNPDDPNYGYYDTTVVPQRLKDAQAELAFQFLKAGTTDVAALPPTVGVVQKVIDVLSTTYSEYSQPTGLARYPRVLAFLRPLLEGSGNNATVVRG